MGMSLQSPDPPFQFHLVPCGDVLLHVAESGAGAAIIFLHGFPEHWRAFAPMMTTLSPDFRCIAPDQVGYGLSSRPTDLARYTLDALSDDVANLIAHLGLKTVHMVAHDWGGLVAWHFAGRHSDVLDRLVVFNAPHPFCLQSALDHDQAQRQASHYANRFSQPNSHDELVAREPEALWNAFFGADEAAGWLSQSDKAALLENWARPDAWTTMLNWYRATGFDYGGNTQVVRNKPVKIHAPTLLIWGQKDPLFAPSVLAPHSDFVSNFRLEMIEDGGHSVFRQHPKRCSDLVRDFLLE